MKLTCRHCGLEIVLVDDRENSWDDGPFFYRHLLEHIPVEQGPIGCRSGVTVATPVDEFIADSVTTWDFLSDQALRDGSLSSSEQSGDGNG